MEGAAERRLRRLQRQFTASSARASDARLSAPAQRPPLLFAGSFTDVFVRSACRYILRNLNENM